MVFAKSDVAKSFENDGCGGGNLLVLDDVEGPEGFDGGTPASPVRFN